MPKLYAMALAWCSWRRPFRGPQDKYSLGNCPVGLSQARKPTCAFNEVVEFGLLMQISKRKVE
jgi:hypothetical protein